MNEADKIAKAARETVDRARQGDQNAEAMLVEVRKNAMRGSKRAQYSFGVMKKYMQSTGTRKTGGTFTGDTPSTALSIYNRPIDTVSAAVIGIPAIAGIFIAGPLGFLIGGGAGWIANKLRSR